MQPESAHTDHARELKKLLERYRWSLAEIEALASAINDLLTNPEADRNWARIMEHQAREVAAQMRADLGEVQS